MKASFGQMASKPLSLFLVVLVMSLLLVRVNGATDTDTGLPALSTATLTSSSTSSTSSATSTTSGTSTTTATTGLPSLTSTGSSTTYPTATVPPTANAPYMKESNLPEGTVFIAVGAALGFIGLSVLVWRAMVAWSINRSVRRAAYEQAKVENKALLRRSSRRKSQRRSTRRRSRRETRGNSMTMEKLSKTDRQSHVSTKTPATQSSLFFSPTAGTGSHLSLNRASTYLPAGYYAAGNTAMGSHSQVNLGRSPPGTPTSPPSRGFDMPFNRSSHHLAASTSTLNLNAPPQGRVPSAYLEDLFDSHPPARPTDRDHS